MTDSTYTEEEHQRALVLQAQGPDEYPYGYYLYLARQEIRRLEEDAFLNTAIQIGERVLRLLYADPDAQVNVVVTRTPEPEGGATLVFEVAEELEV